MKDSQNSSKNQSNSTYLLSKLLICDISANCSGNDHTMKVIILIFLEL